MQGFDDMIQACRDEFAELVAAEKEESSNRMNQVNADVEYSTEAAADALNTLTLDSEARLASDDATSKAAMLEYTQSKIDDFQATVAIEIGKVDAWFSDRLDWAENLYDSYYKEHLVKELNAKKESTIASLQARSDLAQE